jgi:4'-phosphopantetheinyl transferase
MPTNAKHGRVNIPDAIAHKSLDAAPSLANDEIHAWYLKAAENAPGTIGATARAALVRLLCVYAGCARPPVIERGVHGKPFAPELPGLDFNLSHTGTHMMLVFARGQALGVDLEYCNRRISTDVVARRFFAPAEADALERLPVEVRLPAFLRLWTHKEAVLKALGAGLQFGLARVEFTLDGNGEISALARLAPEAGAIAEWQLYPTRPAPGLIGALAWKGPGRALHNFTLAR